MGLSSSGSASAGPVESQRLTTARSRWGLLAAGGTLLAAFAFLAQIHVSACPFYVTTGVPCPGCGMVRAGLALLQGDVGAAAQLHPLIFVAGPILVLESAALALPAVASWRATWRWPNWAVLLLGLAFVLVWAIRLRGGLGGHPDW